MQVKLKTDRQAGEVFQPRGSIVDLPEDEARRYVERNMAEAVETQGRQAPENAMRPPAKGAKR